jgi:hypothetical protein
MTREQAEKKLAMRYKQVYATSINIGGNKYTAHDLKVSRLDDGTYDVFVHLFPVNSKYSPMPISGFITQPKWENVSFYVKSKNLTQDEAIEFRSKYLDEVKGQFTSIENSSYHIQNLHVVQKKDNFYIIEVELKPERLPKIDLFTLLHHLGINYTV